MITKERLKQFEDFMKKCIVFRFQKFLPESSILILNDTEYIDENELKNEKDIKKLQNDLIRKMMSSLINITCELEIQISEDEIDKVVYGEDLEKGLIELYSKKIAEEYNIDFEENPLLKENMDMALKVYKILEEKLDPMVFNSNAIEILESAGIQELIEQNDELALERYAEEQAKVASLKSGSQEETEKIKEEFAKEGVLRLLEIDGKKVIQYIDENHENHLVEIPDDFALSDTYRKVFGDKKSNENINAKEFFDEIKYRFGEMPLDKELDEKTQTAEKIDQVEFVMSNKEFKNQRENGEVLFNNDANKFVLTATNEVVDTEKKDSHIEANISNGISEEKKYLDESDIDSKAKRRDVSEEELSDEDIEDIYVKAESDSLTLDELRSLKRALVEDAKKAQESELAEDIIKNVDEEDLEKLNSDLQEERGPKLSIYSNSKKYSSAAYASLPILFFILSMIISLALLIGAISLILYK